MIKNNPFEYQNLVIYQVFVRNHTMEGTFAALEADLSRICSMGVDVVYLMPIHRIGQLNKKGSLGCPYSIADYRSINPEYGTLQDFRHFIAAAHSLGLKVMIDVVFNHTAHDSVLVQAHPDWFHQDAMGKPVTTVPEWSDVIDLKYPNPQMEQYLLETLSYWVGMGVDGFRCDVASLVPVEFWVAAREALEKIRVGIIWLAESINTGFILDRRIKDLRAHTDSELYEAFDICYDYDIWPVFLKAVAGRIPTVDYLNMLQFQEAVLPQHALKLRFVENHDQQRILTTMPDIERALAWTALQAFNRGPFMIYAGQESGEKKQPSLFDPDKVNWGSYAYQSFITRIAVVRKHAAMQNGRLVFTTGDPAVVGYWFNGEQSLTGVFNVSGRKGRFSVQIPEGDYTDLITGQTFSVKDGMLEIPASSCIFECSLQAEPHLEYSSWMS